MLVGTLAAASGRLILAHVSRHFRGRLSQEPIQNLAAAREAIAGGHKRA
jgi:hypothetical protein